MCVTDPGRDGEPLVFRTTLYFRLTETVGILFVTIYRDELKLRGRWYSDRTHVFIPSRPDGKLSFGQDCCTFVEHPSRTRIVRMGHCAVPRKEGEKVSLTNPTVAGPSLSQLINRYTQAKHL